MRALRDLVDAHDGSDDVPKLPATRELRTEQAMLPRDAFFGPTETVKPREAIGRVSAEFVTPYPPGVPVINFGEVLSEEIVTYLEEFVEAGGFVEGASDPTLQRLRVAA